MNFLIPWLPPILWMAIIFTLSSFQGAQTTATYLPDFIFKKTIHVIEYSILWWLLLRAIRQTTISSTLQAREKSQPKSATTLGNSRESPSADGSPARIGLIALFVTIVYAITDELHQTFTPSREGTIRDIFIDSLGAGLSFLVYINLFTKNSSKV